MARFLFARTDNHQIARDALTGRAAANRRRAWDPVSVVPDGISHGGVIESKNPDGSPDPTTTNPAWLHNISGNELSVNPRFVIVDVPGVLISDPIAENMLEGGEDDGDQQKERRKRFLEIADLPVGKRTVLLASHRVELTAAVLNTATKRRLTP